MRCAVLWLAACPLLGQGVPADLQKRLLRVSEEAEVFRLMAPRMLSQETLVQRALKAPRRFRPRVGDAVGRVPKPQYRSREIVSEYGFSALKQAPGDLHELRQVVSVDGRQILNADQARETLTLGLRSDDDRKKKRMLERFERYGLTGAATDFGQVLLLFTRRSLERYSFAIAGAGRIGTDAALILRFQQQSGPGSLLIFERRKAIYQPLEGELWVRQSDSVPLRVVLRSTRKEKTGLVRDEASVDYIMTTHGVLAPASVVHRQFYGSELRVENVFRYAPFRVFAADTQIKFTEGPRK